MEMSQRAATLAVAVVVSVASLSVAQGKKEMRFNVGPRANVTVMNQFGSISLKPGTANLVIVTATTNSSNVEVDQSQTGNRIDIHSHLLGGANELNGNVDYEVVAPPDASVNLHTGSGLLHVERMKGDLTIEGANPTVDIREVASAHVHVRTLKGPVTLTNIRNGHVEITSVSGDIQLNSVSGPLVQVSSTGGKISYSGDFGAGGDYSLISHTGDIEAAIPSDASVDVSARSVKGAVENDFAMQPKAHSMFPIVQGRSFVGTMGKAASSVVLRTFSGKIRLKQR
jgi:DUF4097 and DUF4098 domain-containing protein YvlB